MRLSKLTTMGTGLAPALLAACASSSYTPATVPVHEGSYASDHPIDSDSLLVVSYNIQFGEKIDQAVADLQSDSLVALADILLLQEMDAQGTDSLARALGCTYVYYPASVHPKHDKGFGNAVLSRWPILSHQVLFLPHAQPLNRQRRVAVSADIDIDGKPLRAISVHLEIPVLSQGQRLNQLQAVVDSLAADDIPTIIAGDFNTSSLDDFAVFHQVMREAGFHRVRIPVTHTARPNWKSQLFSQDLLLDHIFYRGMRSVGAGGLTEALASDHFPVWARLVWPEGS